MVLLLGLTTIHNSTRMVENPWLSHLPDEPYLTLHSFLIWALITFIHSMTQFGAADWNSLQDTTIFLISFSVDWRQIVLGLAVFHTNKSILWKNFVVVVFSRTYSLSLPFTKRGCVSRSTFEKDRTRLKKYYSRRVKMLLSFQNEYTHQNKNLLKKLHNSWWRPHRSQWSHITASRIWEHNSIYNYSSILNNIKL